MEPVARKRKGAPPACTAARSLQDDASRKRACRESEPKPCAGAPDAGFGAPGASGGLVMTAPAASGGAAAGGAVRGLKRKVGCVEAATRMGRRNRLESEYDLGEEIGHGKFGSVRVCRAKNGGGEDFACKTLPKNGGETAHREVEIMQHLSGHPGVVTLRAVFEDADSFYLVMELCRGGRLLDEVAREGRLSERRAANVIRELMSVVKYCHEMGVVHRDIKPENVLRTKTGNLKLADFGLAVRVTNGQKLCGVAGSPAYVAPEVLLGDYSEKVDIWAAGVLLHVLLTASLPFQGSSVQAVFEAIKTVELDFHSGQWESVSLLARDLIGRMLHRDASSRLDADGVLRHPWILFFTEYPLKAEFSTLWDTNKTTMSSIRWEKMKSDYQCSSSESSSSHSDEQDDECGIVDVLTAAITQVRIS